MTDTRMSARRRPAASQTQRLCSRLKRSAACVFLLSTLFAVAVPAREAAAQGSFANTRVVEGKVFAASGAPQSGAVVYLKDQKTLEIRTYISTADGTYRFVQLGTQNDYQLWAEFGGHKSKTKAISSFDSKKTFDISLHIEDK